MPLALHGRQKLKEFLTPLMADVLISEVEDVQRPKNLDGTTQFPQKGDPHPDRTLFPNHYFVHAEPLEGSDAQKYVFHYLAERENQDQYNFEFTEADIGGTKFDAVKRTYVTLREDFTPYDPLMGGVMPNVPAGKFDTDHVLALRSESRTNDPKIDALFVIDEQVFVKRCTITDIKTDKMLGIGVSKTTTLYYRGELVGGVTIESLFADSTNAFWGDQVDGSDVEGSQISDHWFAVTVTSSRDDALLAYKLKLPTTINLTLPDVLASVAAVWNVAGQDGNFDSTWAGDCVWDGDIEASISGSESASAEASRSVQPELAIDIRQPLGRNIPADAYFFYMKLTSDDELSSAEFLARVGLLIDEDVPPTVNYWPAFNPVSHTIVLKGQKVAVSAKASGSAMMSAAENTNPDARTAARISRDKNEGGGTSYDAATTMSVVRLPPTLHDTLTISNATQPTGLTATATCDVGWTEGVTVPAGITLLSVPVAIPAVTATATATMTAAGSVSPTSLPPTDPIKIPDEGYFITDSKISPYEAGWVQCFAEVIDAANL